MQPGTDAFRTGIGIDLQSSNIHRMHLRRVVTACLCVPSILCAGVKTIEDFGGRADGMTDNGPALMKALAFAKENPGTVLRLGGVCRISSPQTDDADGQVNNGGLPMGAGASGVADLTIEDGEILLGGKFGAFRFDHCKGLTIRNVVFDYDPPIISQGRILSSDPAGRKMVVEPDPGYPAPDAEHFPKPGDSWFMVFKPDGEPGFHFVGYVTGEEKSDNGRVTLTHNRPDLAKVLQGAADWRYVRVQRGAHLNVFRFCDEVKLEGCSICGTSGFASLFMFCNDVVVRGNRICPREGRIVSSCADGFHFIGGRRGPRIENNFFDRLVDDNIVISLRGNRVKSARGNQLELQGASVTWYEVGDTIEIVEVGESRRTEYRIVDMTPQKNIWQPPVMTLDRPIEGKIVTEKDEDPGALPTVVFNKSWRQEGTVIRGNVFQNTRRYAVFMGAGGVTIENNAMSNHTSAAILCSYIEMLNNKPNDLIYYFSSDIMIRNNTIVNALNFGEGGRTFDRTHGAIEVYDFDGNIIGTRDLRLPRRISILNNLIVNSGSAGISIANSSDVTVSGNMILFPNRQAQKNGYGINIFASDVSLSNNVFQGPRIDEDVHQSP